MFKQSGRCKPRCRCQPRSRSQPRKALNALNPNADLDYRANLLIREPKACLCAYGVRQGKSNLFSSTRFDPVLLPTAVLPVKAFADAS